MDTSLKNNLTSNADVISKSLDLAPLDVLPPKKVENSQVRDDFEYARGNLIAVIEKGQEALSGILDVAGMSQHPRSYEVVATMINSLTAANKDLLELSKKRKDLEDTDSPKTINNNLFVGSTAELQKLLKNNASEE
jgi:hypothetical protein